jgi:hypothetical protein
MESFWQKAFAPELLSNWALVVVGLGAVGAALWTLRTLRTQTDATVVAANAARDNALALINGERAWVLADNIGTLPDFTPTVDRVQILWIYIPIKNFGNTVARITKAHARAHFFKMDAALSLPKEPEYLEQSPCDILLPPDNIYRLAVGTSGADFSAVKQGLDTFYIYGYVDYIDLANIVRQSRFCFIYHVPRGFSADPAGFYPCGNCPPAYTKCI